MEIDGPLDISRWVIIYPVYINSKKTLAEGRRIAASKACENPTISEIGDCCTHLKLRHALEEKKAYSRDFMQVGRVRIQLRQDDGSLANPEIPSRKILMQKIAELIPKHPGRQKKPEAATSASNAGGKSGKGKGRKR